MSAYKRLTRLRNYSEAAFLRIASESVGNAEECKPISRRTHVHCNFGLIADFITVVISNRCLSLCLSESSVPCEVKA